MITELRPLNQCHTDYRITPSDPVRQLVYLAQPGSGTTPAPPPVTGTSVTLPSAADAHISPNSSFLLVYSSDVRSRSSKASGLGCPPAAASAALRRLIQPRITPCMDSLILNMSGMVRPLTASRGRLKKNSNGIRQMDGRASTYVTVTKQLKRRASTYVTVTKQLMSKHVRDSHEAAEETSENVRDSHEAAEETSEHVLDSHEAADEQART